MQDKLSITFGVSRQMGALLMVQHLGGLFCIVHTLFSVQPAMSMLLGCVVIWHLSHCIKKYVYHHSKSSVVHFSLKPSGEGLFYFNGGLALQGTVLHTHSYLSRYCIVLAIRSRAAKTRYMVIFKDSISYFSYQRLLAHMRAIPMI